MLVLWGRQSTLSLPSFPGPLWPRVGAPERVLSMGQIKLFVILSECKLMTRYIELKRIELFDHLTVKTNN